MKSATRMVTLLLAFALLLGGCTIEVEATPTPTPTPTPSSTPEPVIDDEGNVVEPPPEAQYDGSAVVVINDSSDSPFGLVQETYYMENNPTAVTFGEVVGDTDKLMPTGIRITQDSSMYDEAEFTFDAVFPVAFTSVQYTNGEQVDDGGIPPLEGGGTVEKYGDDGAWTRLSFAQIRTPVPWVSEMLGETLPDTGESEIPTLKDGALRVTLPLSTPGVYRYTLYFRESIDHTEENITTGEDLYRLSMVLIIPMSDKVYDLLFVSDIEFHTDSPESDAEVVGAGFDLMFRTNLKDEYEARDRAPTYNMTRAGMLECKMDSEWVEVTNAMKKFPAIETGDMRSGGASSADMFLSHNSTLTIAFPEFTGEYRLTLAYIDDYDTNYDLVLHFNFDE